MVINDLDFVSIAVPPSKADAPLIVHENAVLARPIALEFLKPIAGRDAKVIEGFRGVDSDEFAKHDSQELGRVSTDGSPLEEGLGVPVGEAFDHLGS